MLYSFQPAIPSSSSKGRLTALQSTPFCDFQVLETFSANLQWICFGCGHVEFVECSEKMKEGGNGVELEVVVVRKRWSANRKLVCQSLPLTLYSQFCATSFFSSSSAVVISSPAVRRGSRLCYASLARGVSVECGVGRHRRRALLMLARKGDPPWQLHICCLPFTMPSALDSRAGCVQTKWCNDKRQYLPTPNDRKDIARKQHIGLTRAFVHYRSSEHHRR
jgi:hypothetical protein